MKKTILLVVAFATQMNFAQNVFPLPSGNVGIGTTSPNFNLSLYGANTGTYTQFTHSGTGTSTNDGFIIGVGSINQGVILNRENTGIEFYTGNIKRLDLTSDGNVGIGMSTPFSKLSIAGSLTLSGGLNNTMSRPDVLPGTLANGEIRSYSGAGNLYDDGFLRMSAGGGTTLGIKSFIDLTGYSIVPDMDRNISFGTSGAERMRIDKNGNVGIGVMSLTNKLDVNGTIHSKEVKVDMSGWSDFVFKKEYNLPSLQQVEKYIAAKGHLANIPSEEEVIKNGINLGEMNGKLLQKIEELTLYSIQQQKEIEVLKSKLSSLDDLSNQIKLLLSETKKRN